MPTSISSPSHRSLFVEVFFNELRLGTATAFVARVRGGKHCYLVTNRHVVTGRNNDNGSCINEYLAMPNMLRVTHNLTEGGLGHFGSVDVKLYQGDVPGMGDELWFESVTLGSTADIVALRISEDPSIALYPYEVEASTMQYIEPGDTVNVIGFPFGEKTSPSFAVWSTGFVASEPAINHNGRPVFLIDCRGRKGQSGSPVIVPGGGTGLFRPKDERKIDNGNIHVLGVYSGRLNDQADLGYVWKSYVLSELLLWADSQT